MATPQVCLDFQLAPSRPVMADLVYKPAQLGIEYTNGFDPDSSTGFFVLRIDPTKVSFNVLGSDSSLFEQAENKRPLVIINGGFFNRVEDGVKPVGLVIADGVQVGSLSNSRRHSGILAIKNGIPQIIWAKDSGSLQAPSALQAGPLVVEPGSKPGIKKDDGRVAKRTLVAIGADGRVYIFITTGVSLFNLQRIVYKTVKGVKSAINLDGGNSSGVIVQTNGLRCRTTPFEPVTPTSIGIFPR